MPDNVEVTAVEIARLAGVGRAAVSNWRRRHADFPQRVGGSEASPTFALADVETWLRDQGKIAEVPVVEQAWRQLETLRDPQHGHPADPLVPAGAFLLLLHRDPAGWQRLHDAPETRLATALPKAIAATVARTLGDQATRLLELPALYGSTQLDLARLLARLAGEHGPAAAYEQLLTRYTEANARQLPFVPAEAAALMAALAADPDGGPSNLLDPACGLGALLAAAPPGTAGNGQDSVPAHAAATLLRLALATPGDAPGPLPLSIRTGDALRSDADPGLAAGAVLCRPPYNQRDWGHEELQYSPWLFGQVPPRTESELAWVLHCLAHTGPGGTAVLLLPPTVASRRAGRRLRAELLRRSALRAVVALPAGAAPPYGVPLHLWVLRRPVEPADPAPYLLLVDAARTQPDEGGGRARVDWPELHRTVLDAWRDFDAAIRSGVQPPEGRPGVHRAIPVINLFDDETDLSPARHLPDAVLAADAGRIPQLRGRLADTLAGLASLDETLPATEPRTTAPDTAIGPEVTVGELARAGALAVHNPGQLRTAPLHDRTKGRPVITDQDVLTGLSRPTAALDGEPESEPLTAAPGDVLVPVLGGGAVALVVEEGSPVAGAAVGRNLQLLRPDPALLDPHFLAGYLRAGASSRRASSHASSTARLDVRRVRLPRLPLAEQHRYGAAFHRLAAFQLALREAADLGRQLAQDLTDGLAEGTLQPAEHPQR